MHMTQHFLGLEPFLPTEEKSECVSCCSQELVLQWHRITCRVPILERYSAYSVALCDWLIIYHSAKVCQWSDK
ncbi:hypothetical protein Y1Q_0010226 [Alligator mississippiensis]|uniref:Uncharacterized protein n=1 Tax=Alligator mississippiensis TaxID=8496 RepID=A0A151NG52_ALLMI|nr:hypothetical protein Y1Q_0010226 [Alligator mississippiensis]